MKALLAAMAAKPEPKEDDAKAESDEGLTACAQEVIDAVGSGDPAALASALKAFMEMC